MKRNGWLLVIPLSLLAGTALGQAPATSAAVPTRPVAVAKVGTGAVVEGVELIGELQGMEEIRIFSQVPERIRTLAVREGSVVKAGEVLATVWAEAQTEGYNQAQAGLEAAIANRDAVRDNVERMRALLKVGSATQSQLDGLEAQLRAAEAQVRQAAAGVSAASAQKDRTLIKSPIAGVVAQVQVREGDLAAPSLPIMTVVKPDRLKAVLRVPERDFLRVKQGMPVRLAPLAVPTQQVQAKVTLKGPVVDRLTRTGLVEVHLDNKEGQLVPGSTVRVFIELSRREGVVLVPADAVLLTTETERTGEALAFVAEGEVAKKREV
ncbi:MAG: efflux RND transporter periplasmic adaptor subunit, partial [Myxococcales bacterium]